VEEVSLNFEEKRDRWNGYNPDEQLDSIREWEVVEAQRKIKRELSPSTLNNNCHLASVDV
jgi:pre-mRNA-processing factor SLU7